MANIFSKAIPDEMQGLLQGGMEPDNPFGQPSADSQVRARQFANAKRFIASFGPEASASSIQEYAAKYVPPDDTMKDIGYDDKAFRPSSFVTSSGRALANYRRPFRSAFSEAISRKRNREITHDVRARVSAEAEGRRKFKRITGRRMKTTGAVDVARRRVPPRNRRERRGSRGTDREGWGDGDNYYWPKGYALEQMIYPMELNYDAAVVTDGSGVWQGVYSDLAANSPNWASFATPFEQYRVTKFVVRFEPLRVFGGSTAVTFGPVVSVLDRDDSTALTGYSVGDRYGSAKMVPGNRAFRKTMVASGINELGFLDCTSASADLWIKVYSSGNTASTTIGRVFITYFVLFKGMGLT